MRFFFKIITPIIPPMVLGFIVKLQYESGFAVLLSESMRNILYIFLIIHAYILFCSLVTFWIFTIPYMVLLKKFLKHVWCSSYLIFQHGGVTLIHKCSREKHWKQGASLYGHPINSQYTSCRFFLICTSFGSNYNAFMWM